MYAYTYTKDAGNNLFLLWSYTSGTQGLLLALHPQVTPGRARGPSGVLGIEHRSTTCKASALPHCTIISAPQEILNIYIMKEEDLLKKTKLDQCVSNTFPM